MARRVEYNWHDDKADSFVITQVPNCPSGIEVFAEHYDGDIWASPPDGAPEGNLICGPSSVMVDVALAIIYWAGAEQKALDAIRRRGIPDHNSEGPQPAQGPMQARQLVEVKDDG